jgi:hypothetical protein
MVEKIYFDELTFIWKEKLKLSDYREVQLQEAFRIINSVNDLNKKTDAYGYLKSREVDSVGNILIKNKLDEICQLGINVCKQLYESEFNKVNSDAWINVVRSKDPVQPKLTGSKYHIHTDIQSKIGKFYPHYTYVYYIQMPDVVADGDGALCIQGMNETEYQIRPEEDDLIILPGHLPHGVNPAIKSTVDRIVMAGNVGFEYVKQQKSLV